MSTGAAVPQPADDPRAPVWAATFAVLVVYAGAIILTDEYLLAGRVDPAALRLALAFGLVQIAAVVVIFIGLVVRRRVMSRRARRSAELRTRAGALVAEHAAGTDALRRLRQLQRRSRRDVRAAVRSFLVSTRGTMQTRVTALAADLDIDLAGGSELPSLAELARLSLRDRAILADRLAPRAGQILTELGPRPLSAADPRKIIAVLDLVRAWRRMLPVPDLESALVHPDAEVRWRAYEAVVYTQPLRSERLRDGLRDGDARVRAAAASAARRIRDPRLRDDLEAAMREGDRDVAVAAALALAALPDGVDTLQAIVASGSRNEASVAFEALEKAAIGRLESV